MTIKVLDIDVAEKIAAGEVIERPFCVVKELLENSIDAGADRINIELKNKGLDLIKISDNGSGMEKEDLNLCILRHATSKITNIDDLEKIHTMGFRGEALAAVARVSKLEIRTCTTDQDIGVRLYTEGANNVKIEETGAPQGTQIIVKDLFYNTPARKKFLKTPQTEYSYIYQTIEKTALAFPHISFLLTVDGRQKINLPKTRNRTERIQAIFGKEVTNGIIPINFQNHFLKISGFISKPDIWERKRNNHSVFINNRPVVSKVILGAINEAYREYILKNRFPIVFLFLEMSGEFFDVNVHPRKMEVKFVNERELFVLVKQAIEFTLNEHNTKDSLAKTPIQLKEPKSNTRYKVSDIKKIYKDYARKREDHIKPELSEPNLNFKEKTKFFENIDTIYKVDSQKSKISENDRGGSRSPGVHSKNDRSQYNLSSSERSSGDPKSSVSKSPTNSDFFESQITPIAWLPKKFILAHNTNQDLVIIDQHAAHERIVYERTKDEFENSKIQSQGLLVPTILELRLHLYESLKTNTEHLEKLGFFIEEFGKNTFLIKSVPSLLENGSEKEILTQIAEKLLENEKKVLSETSDMTDKIIMIACKNSIKANQRLDIKEMEQIIKKLLKCTNPYHCPHGRPTIIKFENSEIEKKFGRINV